MVVKQRYHSYMGNFHGQKKGPCMWTFLVEWFQGKMVWQIWSDGLPNNILKVKPSSLSDKMLFFEGLIMHSMEITVSTCSCSTFMSSCNVQLGSLTLIASSSWLAEPSLSELLSVSSPPTYTLSESLSDVMSGRLTLICMSIMALWRPSSS